MFSFESFLDLPLIWYALISTAVFLYILLDGFDLGVGILFPFAPSDRCRDRMMNSVAPFWDGNETWLVLGGGGLFAAFPLAYAILMSAFYIPIILMLLGLIFRGVAFEFRFKATGRSQRIWDFSFHLGSLTATFMQGIVLGTFVHGIAVEGRSFAGGPLDWLTPFSLMTGAALVSGYALLGATWTIMKTEGQTQAWARKSARYVMLFVALFMGLVSLTMPLMNADIKNLWFSLPNFYFLQPMPILSVLFFILLWRDLRGEEREYRPFLLTLGIFLMNYIGIGVSTWPWLVPFKITFREAAAVPASQSMMLLGTAFLLPIILAYTGYCFWVFRGKASHEHDAAY
ncbi:cytochrome d ubiquinol oxidase subunit II [Desulfosarcina ovata]|uniref:Cytochrome D ubiquinol oxidase subunit II n=2 Tax=Desulfosarcina ovata TaxID=83564 RepID=A0A5K8AEV2_9BACT|nr:cytochrome d ubiquinol oxidase subunit II [Desulfosarcina ovata]BBO84680.1 cytochrome D ubiquinol oxidase subunit II [Desulfosarcina ovata subsp. sediminis]BBO91172.1 cytochrome D ubiquinol oxidase subunit II [Desulfosarcina ovata subsp. ovata]